MRDSSVWLQLAFGHRNGAVSFCFQQCNLKAESACFFWMAPFCPNSPLGFYPLQLSSAAGTGDSWMEGALSSIGQQYPGKACGMPVFSEEAAHLLLAAADYLMVPSRFEPCGLVAQYALRYGAVPIVTATGGLRDIVSPEVCPAPSPLVAIFKLDLFCMPCLVQGLVLPAVAAC